jgi:Ser/Thr protein kinase RdoA (MazF antagonist)
MVSTIWTPASTNGIAPVLEQFQINPSTVKLFANTMANTNEIYMVERPNSEPIVIRAVNPQTYGVVRSKLAHVRFEIEVLDHLNSCHFPLTPMVLRNAQGESITYWDEKAHVAFNLMPGRPVGNFNDLAGLTQERRASLFFGLGQMSKILSQLELPSLSEKTLLDLSLEAHPSFSRLLPQLDTAGQELLGPHSTRIQDFAERALGELQDTKYGAVPRHPVHFDLHAGNVLFEGNKLTAVLDWDWSRLDCRVSDMASCLAMCCYIYGGQDDGLYLQEQINVGVRAFRQGFGKSELSLSEENRLLVAAFKGYVLLQFIFTVELYLASPKSESLVDLQHFLRLIVCNDFDRLLENFD